MQPSTLTMAGVARGLQSVEEEGERAYRHRHRESLGGRGLTAGKAGLAAQRR